MKGQVARLMIDAHDKPTVLEILLVFLLGLGFVGFCLSLGLILAFAIHAR